MSEIISQNGVVKKGQREGGGDPTGAQFHAPGGLSDQMCILVVQLPAVADGKHTSIRKVRRPSAHVPASVQALVLSFNSPTFLSLYPDIAEQIMAFEAQAAKQMLKYRLGSGTQAFGDINISTGHLNFLTELNNLNNCNGFPKTTRNVGISLGSWSGTLQRANFDGDNDGQNDFQYPGFPSASINFPESAHDGTVDVWNLNECQTVAAVSLQSFLSTAWSYNYPLY